jgi:cold shock CspA family protein
MRKSGVIKKYFSNRGFGFLGADEGGADLFFHVTDCLDDDSDLIGGRRVEFEEGRDRGGRRIAKGVMLLRRTARRDRRDWQADQGGQRKGRRRGVVAFAHTRTVTAMTLGRDAMTAKALAAWLEISESELMYWANIKKLPFVSDGQGGLYVERRHIAQWQEAIKGSPGF